VHGKALPELRFVRLQVTAAWGAAALGAKAAGLELQLDYSSHVLDLQDVEE
jgi:hypothetical protein